MDIDISGIEKFLHSVNYYGPFSVEFLHYNGKNYFMEVNFRNDGLYQTATAAGANLHALYVNDAMKFNLQKVHKIYMMNYAIDYLHVKEGRISKMKWWRDFMRTRCFINFSISDPMPVVAHYLKKLHLLK